MRKNKLFVLLAAFCLTLTCAAAELGSIRVVVEDGEDIQICLHRVLDENGVFLPDFQESGIQAGNLTGKDGSRENARILYEYAVEHSLEGKTLALTEDAAMFDGLMPGTYLLYGVGEKVDFVPFLVTIPTEIKGKPVYDLEAYPKESEQETTQPTQPTTPPTNIPQTGVDRRAMYLLLTAGFCILCLGCWEISRGRKECDE